MTPIMMLPDDLLIQVAGTVGSLPDLMALMSCCRRFRSIFENHAWTVSQNALSLSIVCERQAWMLLSVQEGIPTTRAKSPAIWTPAMVLRLTRNAAKVNKAVEWFNKEQMIYIKPEKVLLRDEHYRLWGSYRRPPHLTNPERRRFECGYYLAVAIMHPAGRCLLGQVPLRYVYYAWEMLRLEIPIGEELPRPPTCPESEQRLQAQEACRARMDEVWQSVYASRDLPERNTIHHTSTFGCFGRHLCIFDQYQDQARMELLNGPRCKRPKVDLASDDLKEQIWGYLSDDDDDDDKKQ